MHKTKRQGNVRQIQQGKVVENGWHIKNPMCENHSEDKAHSHEHKENNLLQVERLANIIENDKADKSGYHDSDRRNLVYV